MMYHPGHFHGISHEADIQWLINLPIAQQTFVGDGQTTRFRIKFEARIIASYGGTIGIHHDNLAAAIGSRNASAVVNIMLENSFARSVEIDEDSHYLNIEPALANAQELTVTYHYVRPL